MRAWLAGIAAVPLLAVGVQNIGGFNTLREPVWYSAQGQSVHKFGRNPDIDNGTGEEVIWDVGGATYPGFITSALAVRIKAGGNTNDTAAGSHCQSVAVYGLDENWSLANESIATNGASVSSSTTTTFIRVFRAFCEVVGTYGNTNAGNIVIETTGGTTVAQINAGNGQTEMAIYTVPAGYTMYLWNIGGSADSTKSVTFELNMRFDADNTASPRAIRLQYSQDASTGFWERNAWPIPLKVPEKTDIWFSASLDAAGNATVDANFVATLHQNG